MRLQIKQMIDIAYDDTHATPPSALMALRATEDPTLMRLRRMVKTNDTPTARSGIFPETCESQLEPGNPRSRAKDL